MYHYCLTNTYSFSSSSRDTIAFLDQKDRIIAVAVGRPTGQDGGGDWADVERGVRAALLELQKDFNFREHHERRGDYQSATYGISFGGGQKRPGMLKMSDRNQEVFKTFLDNPYVQRMVGYSESAFASYFPNVYREYVQLFARMADRYPGFEPPMGSHGHFAAMSGNVRRAQTYLHLDEMNKANGICPIFNTGNFDPVKGGHLILQQLGVVVEFPPGTVMLIPSATLVHGNVAIQEHEERESITLYTAGGLFRWAEYGFRTEKDLKAKYPERWAAELKDRKGRWARAVAQYSTPYSLINDRKEALSQIRNDLNSMINHAG
ncbi:hypothetical protein BDY19DRAFT_900567 [Irpex rosettiformis]|uniref:Uncharacterized protein n=1 Tax=Irpex rosettiformis TaxID=378272 RepID=A0ACB8TMT5_9APHY|nr:hypothetical protein BDY19DRAFT_900567 [Irpex rosettiformis]